MASKKTILIIEQELNLANGLKAILEKEGYRVAAGAHYSRLGNTESGQAPDLVILDIYMPQEFGLNILRKVKAGYPSLPVIAMSVYSHSLSRDEIKRFGGDELIIKPFEIEYLKMRIEELLAGSKPR
ncbi:MAG TPA: hypothetical protein DCY56_00255 [Candidatus Omnitrophica bacterium]|nr:hypothetical protein [Candidatus Omnitrophota bacterium]